VGDKGPPDCNVTSALSCAIPWVLLRVLVVLLRDSEGVFGVVLCVSNGVGSDEHFIFFQPQKNGCFSVGCLLDFRDGFRAVDNAADGYLLGFFACWRVNQKEFFEFFLIFWELIVIRII